MITFPDPDLQTYPGLFDLFTQRLSADGYGLIEQFSNGVGTWVAQGPGTDAENEAYVQNAINTYNPVPGLKKLRRAEFRTERENRYYNEFPPDLEIVDERLQAVARDQFSNVVELVFAHWGSLTAAAKSPNAKWQKMMDIRLAARNAITAVNAATTKAGVLAVTASWPA